MKTQSATLCLNSSNILIINILDLKQISCFNSLSTEVYKSKIRPVSLNFSSQPSSNPTMQNPNNIALSHALDDIQMSYEAKPQVIQTPAPSHGTNLTAESLLAILEQNQKAADERLRVQNEAFARQLIIEREAADARMLILAEKLHSAKLTLPTNTLEVIGRAREVITAAYEGKPPSEPEVKLWRNAFDSYSISTNVREAFESGEIPEDLKTFAKYSKLFGAKGKPSAAANRKTPGKSSICSRCGRNGHDKSKCYATNHIDGNEL